MGDTPSAMVVREVKEESGYDVVPRKLAALFDRNKHPHPPISSHAYKLFFLCDLMGGEAAPSFETPEVGFFPRNELPSSRPRVSPNTRYSICSSMPRIPNGRPRSIEWNTVWDAARGFQLSRTPNLVQVLRNN